MTWHQRLALGLIGVALLGVGATYGVFRHEMKDLRERMTEESTVAATALGPVEYAMGGQGPPVLAIHGAGGGFDQGRLIATRFLPDTVSWIAPSRFGYLRSPLPDDSSTAAQADTFAALLDVLEIERVSVVAMSGGVPPALHFAARHPDRASALILLSSAPFAPLTAEEQALPVPLWVYNVLFRTDFPFWVAIHGTPRALAHLFDARPALLAAASAEERAFLTEMTGSFLPATERADGLSNEGAAIDGRAVDPLPAIKAPTLIIHARDDRITPFSTAEFLARRVDGADLLAFETGGHLLLGHHREAVGRIADFLEGRDGNLHHLSGH